MIKSRSACSAHIASITCNGAGGICARARRDMTPCARPWKSGGPIRASENRTIDRSERTIASNGRALQTAVRFRLAANASRIAYPAQSIACVAIVIRQPVHMGLASFPLGMPDRERITLLIWLDAIGWLFILAGAFALVTAAIAYAIGL